MMERDLIREAKKYVHQQGGVAYKMHGGPFMEPGVPDLIICYKGRFVGAEAKMPDGKVSPMQQQQLDRIRFAYGTSFVFRSLAEFVEQLNKMAVDNLGEK